METPSRARINRLVTVGLGTFIWVSVIRLLFGDKVALIWPIMLSVWIALGSAHLVANVRNFHERMSGRAVLLAALISPAWPWLK